MISLSAFDLTPSKALRHEWLMANGRGGYSSSTAIGMNARKYHGLLVADLSNLSGKTASRAPVAKGRHVLLSKFEEAVESDGVEFQLSTNAYPNAIYPEGFRHLVGFEFSSHPTFIYSLGGRRLEKSIRLVHGKDTVVVSYRIVGKGAASIFVRPLLFPRPIHSDPTVSDKRIEFSHDSRGFELNSPSHMRVCSSHGRFSPAPTNYRNAIYSLERERGYPHAETLFSPGGFSASLSQGEELHFCCSLDGLSPSEALDLLDRQSARLARLQSQFSQSSGVPRTDFSDMLCLAADSFVVSAAGKEGIIAGYPWFSQWGRDAMISLPGLLLSTGRIPLAREILLRHAASIRGGLLPNFTGEDGQPSYNSSDAPLWFINAVRQFAEHTGDFEFVRNSLWKPMRAILSSYVQGNELARMDDDCLIRTLAPAMTWMDAQVDGVAVTSRKGKCVEINALWRSNLCFMLELSGRFNDRRTASIVAPIAEGAKNSFQKFLSAGDGGLFDVIEPADSSLRPNQIFAVSLPHSPLNRIQQLYVFNLVRARLYTPLGLRTLAVQDSRYHGEYTGNSQQRDSAYHQGMIWPWLLGAFYDAQLRVHPESAPQILSALKPLAAAMREGCAGTLPEIYEPKSMSPAGAVSQAWSVAEALRIYTKVKGAVSIPRQFSFSRPLSACCNQGQLAPDRNRMLG